MDALVKATVYITSESCNLEREYRDCIKAEETRLGSQGISHARSAI